MPRAELVPRVVQAPGRRHEDAHEPGLDRRGLEAADEEPGPVEPRAHGSLELGRELADLALEGGTALRDELGRGARRRGAKVGREVREGPVDLVADRADDGDARGGYRPHDELVGEGQEVLEGAAAACPR